MRDPHVADDDALPHTGIPIERERALSAAFIETPEYGTRGTTALRVTMKEGVRLTVEIRSAATTTARTAPFARARSSARSRSTSTRRRRAEHASRRRATRARSTMRHTGFDERFTDRREAVPQVERHGRILRVEPYDDFAATPRRLQQRVQHR